MTKSPSTTSNPKLTPEHVATLHRTVAEAGLKIKSMHLIPADVGGVAAAVDPDPVGACRLPNGDHYLWRRSECVAKGGTFTAPD
jgi:hypothetical protein